MTKMSRDKGAAFERRCCKIMESVVFPEYPHWKRTRGGERQWLGDIQPCHADGEPRAMQVPIMVECKKRKVIIQSEFKQWIKKLNEECKGKPWILMYAQDNGPVHILCEGFVLEGEGLQSHIYLTFHRG